MFFCWPNNQSIEDHIYLALLGILDLQLEHPRLLWYGHLQ